MGRKDTTTGKVYEYIVKYGKDGISAKELHELTGFSMSVIYKAIERLMERGKIKEKGLRDRTTIFVAVDRNEEVKIENGAIKKLKSIEIKEDIVKLIDYFINKYGIKDYNVAINYLLIRGLLIELNLSKIGFHDTNKILNELNNLKKRIRRAYIKKLAKQKIKKIEEESKRELENLSEILNS